MWELDHKEGWVLRNSCFRAVALESILENPLTARRSNQSILKEINPNILWKDWCQSWSSNTLATWCKEPIHWKKPWCWERQKAGEGDNRGWDGWMASPTLCTWVWVSIGGWWWTGKPGVLQYMGLKRVRYYLATEQQKPKRDLSASVSVLFHNSQKVKAAHRFHQWMSG